MIYGVKRLLFRIGEGCNTGCNGCLDNFKKAKYYDANRIKQNLNKVFKVFNNDYDILFFGIDIIKHNDIESILSYTYNLYPINGIGVQISEINNYKISDFNLLIKMVSKYGLHIYISTNILNLNNYNFKKILILLELFNKNFPNNLSVQIYYKNKKELLISKNFKLLAQYTNIKLDISIGLIKNNVNKTIFNEDKTCKYYNNISIKKSNIYFNDIGKYYDIEIKLNGDIIPHIPRCYMANINISNIYLNFDMILYNFALFIDFLITINDNKNSFEENCYSCVNRYNFNYKVFLGK